LLKYCLDLWLIQQENLSNFWYDIESIKGEILSIHLD
jgi:hypothetical protein